MFGAAAMIACLAVGGAVTLSDLMIGALAVDALAGIRAQFILVVKLAIFETLDRPFTGLFRLNKLTYFFLGHVLVLVAK